MTHLDLESITSTSEIDPAEYSAKVNRDEVSRLRYSIAGFLHMIRRHRSIRNLSVVTVVLMALGVWVEIGWLGWALMFQSLGMVWVTEFMNTAIEATVNLATREIHPMAKVAKDVASAAVFMSFLLALAVCSLVLIPPILARLGS